MLGEAKIVFKNRRSLCGAGISDAGAAETDGGKIGNAGCALLLGGFDGLHKGHETLLAAAKQTGLKVAAIAITGGKGAPIYTEAERDYIFAENGISAVYPLKFAAIRDMSAAEFACAVRDEIAPEVCFCGEDFRFGSGGKANGDDFARLSGVPVRVLPVLKDAATGEKIGAEHIKALLKNGDVSAADKLLCGGFILKDVFLSFLLPPKNTVGEGVEICKFIQSLLACSLNGSGGQVHTRRDLAPRLLLKIVLSDDVLLPLVQKPDVMQRPVSLMT